MALRDWWREFAPRKCTKVRKQEAVAYMRRFFTGCTKENLAKHGLWMNRIDFYDIGEKTSVFDVSAKNNALCVHYLYPGSCKDCPVVKRTGRFCDQGLDSPYLVLVETGSNARWLEVLAPREIF